MKVRIPNGAYTFTASAGTISFDTYGSIEIEGVLLVTNVVTNELIYSFADPALGGTVSTNILTLTFDTSSMSDSDELQIWYDDPTATLAVGSVTLDAPTLAALELIGIKGVDGSTISSNSNPVPVSDAGGSLTVDAVNLDIRDLVFATDKVDVSGSSVSVSNFPASISGFSLEATQLLVKTDLDSILTSVQSIDLGIPAALGQTTMSASMPVVLASDQSAIPVTGTFWQATQPVSISGTVPVSGSLTISESTDALDSYDTIDSIGDKLDQLLLSQDIEENVPLYTTDIGLKKGLDGGLLFSDAPLPIYGSSSIANGVILDIDTIGYQSIVIHVLTLGTTATVQTSNNRSSWSSLVGVGGSVTNFTSTISTTGLWTFPCIGRYVRVINNGSSLDAMIAYLRNQPANTFTNSGSPINVQSIGGVASAIPITLISSGSTSTMTGQLSVGSTTNVPGGTNVAYPLIIGGSEQFGLGALGGRVRTMLEDSYGRVIVTGGNQGQDRRGNYYTETPSPIPISTTEVTLHEGSSQIQIMAQFLAELKVVSSLLADLPFNIQRALNNTQLIYSNEEDLDGMRNEFLNNNN